MKNLRVFGGVPGWVLCFYGGALLPAGQQRKENDDLDHLRGDQPYNRSGAGLHLLDVRDCYLRRDGGANRVLRVQIRSDDSLVLRFQCVLELDRCRHDSFLHRHLLGAEGEVDDCLHLYFRSPAR